MARETAAKKVAKYNYRLEIIRDDTAIEVFHFNNYDIVVALVTAASFSTKKAIFDSAEVFRSSDNSLVGTIESGRFVEGD